MEYINIFLWVYGSFFALVVLFGFAIQRNKERGFKQGEKINADEITVLIPFRDEAKRLPELLESIESLEKLPSRFVFIDDHSSDDSVALIQEILKNVPFELVQLSEEEQGKKAAIREGAKYVTTEFTLTWDADVYVGSAYFSHIESLSKADMYVLPAIFSARTLLQHLFTFDVLVANAVNVGLAGWRRPIFASGANLLYRTRSFEQFDNLAAHGHISSGDDTFLLRDFTRSKATVRLYSDPLVSVKTKAPSSLKEVVQQRLRWVSKTKAIKDPLNIVVALKQLMLTLLFLALIVGLAVSGKWFFLVYLIVCKLLTDLLIFWAYFKRTATTRTFLLLPLAELWFPLYSLLLVVLMPFYQPIWKGRKVISK